MSDTPTPTGGQVELKPCPFCGSHPFSGDVCGDDPSGERYGYWAIECQKCGTDRFCGAHASDEAEAVTRWNTRATDAENAALREEVEKRAENVSPEEVNELQDVLRTIVPTGRAFITSARELVATFERVKAERDSLRATNAGLVGALEEASRDLKYALIISSDPGETVVTEPQRFEAIRERAKRGVASIKQALDAAKGGEG